MKCRHIEEWGVFNLQRIKQTKPMKYEQIFFNHKNRLMKIFWPHQNAQYNKENHT